MMVKSLTAASTIPTIGNLLVPLLVAAVAGVALGVANGNFAAVASAIPNERTTNPTLSIKDVVRDETTSLTLEGLIVVGVVDNALILTIPADVLTVCTRHELSPVMSLASLLENLN
jgi:hypothetical protein